MKINENKVKCVICKQEFKSITDSHLKKHGLKLTDYRRLFCESSDDFKRCSYVTENYENKENFTPWKCILNSSSDSEKNLCVLHSEDQQKDQEHFNISFNSLIKLYESLKYDYHFEGIIFPPNFRILDKTFNKSIIFSGSKFLGDVEFKVTFHQKAIFRCCTFCGDANFGTSKFMGKVSFEKSVFKKEVSFRRSVFMEEASFWRVEFSAKTNFFQTQFDNQVYFGHGAFPREPNVIILIDTKFSSPKKTLFAGVDLSNTLFRYTDLIQINFSNVKWAVTSRLKGKRRVVFDEIDRDRNVKIWTTESSTCPYGDVKNLYQQLTRNFEERRSFSEAGDFYFGEMECYRKSNVFRRYLPSIVNLYRISSGYGQRYIRAGIILVLLLLIFSTSHLFFGLKPNKHNTYYSKIQYSFDTVLKNLDTFISDVLISTIYCTEVLIREEEQDRLFRPLNVSGEILNSIFSILVYVQILFFILALRRHFKR